MMLTTISANINSFEVNIVPAIKVGLLIGCPFTDAILVAPSDSPVETVTSHKLSKADKESEQHMVFLHA